MSHSIDVSVLKVVVFVSAIVGTYTLLDTRVVSTYFFPAAETADPAKPPSFTLLESHPVDIWRDEANGCYYIGRNKQPRLNPDTTIYCE